MKKDSSKRHKEDERARRGKTGFQQFSMWDAPWNIEAIKCWPKCPRSSQGKSRRAAGVNVKQLKEFARP